MRFTLIRVTRDWTLSRQTLAENSYFLSILWLECLLPRGFCLPVA